MFRNKENDEGLTCDTQISASKRTIVILVWSFTDFGNFGDGDYTFADSGNKLHDCHFRWFALQILAIDYTIVIFTFGFCRFWHINNSLSAIR